MAGQVVVVVGAGHGWATFPYAVASQNMATPWATVCRYLIDHSVLAKPILMDRFATRHTVSLILIDRRHTVSPILIEHSDFDWSDLYKSLLHCNTL